MFNRSLHSPKGHLTFELSAPYRILAMALRRSILKGIENLDDTFNGQFIRIKKDFLNYPVFSLARPRALQLTPASR